VSASYALTSSYDIQLQISDSWASSSLSASVAVSASFATTASYVLSASYVNSATHVEFGIISGSDFVGAPLIYNIFYTKLFPNTIYTVSIIGDEARIWSTTNRSVSGFTINSNSNAALTEMVMWRVEG
jgi:hypothetical protein